VSAAQVPGWPRVAALAQVLSEAGQLVTQLHCTDDVCPASWAHGDATTHVVAGADRNAVVTTDGTVHLVDEVAA
jgi:hypothetical protein